jgi:hypothetical protein
MINVVQEAIDRAARAVHPADKAYAVTLLKAARRSIEAAPSDPRFAAIDAALAGLADDSDDSDMRADRARDVAQRSPEVPWHDRRADVN